MRKLIMWNLTTLDGCFEGPRVWDLEFHEYAWGEELREFSLEQGREVGALLFGRVTYEGMAAFKRDSAPLTLELLEQRPLGDRCLLLRYRPAAIAAGAG